MRQVRVRAVIEHEDQFLFVQHAPSSTYWALPGGHLEPGETLVDGIRREVYEELGVRAEVGRLLYVHQLFLDADESLEFFFEVTNGRDFTHLQLDNTSHGMLELARAEFINPASEHVLPEFLRQLSDDLRAADWPKIFVHPSEQL